MWADLDPTLGHEQSGRRPVLVLSSTVFNQRSGTVIACALTSQPPRSEFPLTLEIDVAELPKRSWAKISQIRVLSVQRLGRTLGRLPEAQLERVPDGLDEIMDRKPRS